LSYQGGKKLKKNKKKKTGFTAAGGKGKSKLSTSAVPQKPPNVKSPAGKHWG